jgi:hypothetical protein
MNQTSMECCGQLSERCQGWSTKVKLSHWRKASSNPRFVHKSGSQMVCRPCRDAFQEVLKVPEVLVRAPEVVATEQRQGRSAQAKPVRTPRTERPEPLKKRRSHTELLACGYRGDRHNEPNMLWLQQRPEAMDDALLLGAGSTASSTSSMVEELPATGNPPTTDATQPTTDVAPKSPSRAAPPVAPKSPVPKFSPGRQVSK